MITISSLPATIRVACPEGRAELIWAERISAAFQSSLIGILETGRLLIEAKAELPHGEFMAMVEADLPFSPRSAQCFMAIAKDQRLANAQYIALLPPNWGTLYDLTRLSDAEFEAKIADGTINPKMERKAIAPPRAKVSVPGKNVVPINPPSRPTRGREAIIARVKDAIVALSGLPRAADVVGYFSGTDQSIIVGERLSDASQWLSEFSALWPKGDNSAEAAE